MPDAYAGWKLQPAESAADYSGWKLQPAEAPPAPTQEPGILSRFLSWATTPSEGYRKAVIEPNQAAAAKYPAPVPSFLSGLRLTKDSGDFRAGAQALVSGIPGYHAADESPEAQARMQQFRTDHPIASFLLPLAGAGAKPAYLPAMAPKAPPAALSALQRLEARLTNQVGDQAVKGAEQTANSAVGSLRSAKGDTSTILKALERVTGDPEVDAASRAILESPAGKKLIMSVVTNAQERAPEALDRVESLKALVDETHAGIPAAREAATSDAGLKAALAQRTKDQLGRYIIPAVGGAAGAAVGGPVGMGIGAAAGRGVSPGVRAVVLNNVLAPERRLLMTRAAMGTVEKMVAVPEKLGKFALPLTQAAQRGPDALAAAHYVLSQDPEYQQHMHAAAEESP